MSKFIIQIRKISSFKIGVKIQCSESDEYMRVVNALKKIISVTYDKPNRENVISMYYYEDLMRVVTRFNAEIYLSPEVKPAYEMAVRRHSIQPDIADFKYPSLWNDKQKLHDIQKEIVDISIKRRRYINGCDMGCISGNAEVSINRAGKSRKIKLSDLYLRFNELDKRPGNNFTKRIPTQIRCLKGEHFGLHTIKKVLYKGIKTTYLIELESGKKLELTKDHKLLTKKGNWISLQKLKVGKFITVNGNLSCKRCGSTEGVISYRYAKFIGYCKKCMLKYLREDKHKRIGIFRRQDKDGYIYLTGSGVKYEKRRFSSGLLEHVYIMEKHLGRPLTKHEQVHHINKIRNDNRLKNLKVLTLSEHSRMHESQNNFKDYIGRGGEIVITIPKYEKIIKITKSIKQEVYDIVMDDPYRNFVANGIVVHNCGKTPMAICTFLTFIDFGYNRVLITVPSRLRQQWVNEILKFTTLQRKDIIILAGDDYCSTGDSDRCLVSSPVCKTCFKFEACKAYKRAKTPVRVKKQIESDCKIFVAGYETVRDNSETVRKGKFDVYIFDEASKFKNITSQIYKRINAMLKTSHPMDVVIPMSGTLIENRVQEIYPIFSLVDQNVFGNYDSFKWKFLIFDFFGSPVGVKNVKELKEIFKKYIIRRTLAEVWKDRPKFYSFVRECEMSPLQGKVYESIKEQKTEEIRSDLNISKDKCVAIISYLMIAASSTEGMVDDGKNKHLEHSAKLDMFIEMMENEIEGKVVLFCHFTQKVMPFIIAGLKQAKIKFLQLTPEIPDHEKVKKQFENDASVRVLVCSDAVSYGTNMQMANYVVHFDLPWNPAKTDQRTARVYRTGQTKAVTCIYLITKGTIDEYVLNTNYDKRNLFEMFFTPGLKVDNKHSSISPKALLEMLNV